MPNAYLIPNRNVSIEGVSEHISGFFNATYQLEAFVNRVPVEKGFAVNDHSIALPDKLTLEGFVSDMTEAGTSLPSDAFATVKALNDATATLTVVTPWYTFDEMIINAFDAREIGGAMRFTMELTKLIRVDSVENQIDTDNSDGPAADRSSEINRGKVISSERDSGNYDNLYVL